MGQGQYLLKWNILQISLCLTLAKEMQWSLSNGLWAFSNHIRRIAYWNYCTKDDWPILSYSGWKFTIVGFGVASCGTAQSMLHASNITKTRKALQVTVFAFYKVIRFSYKINVILEGKNTNFDIWCQERCDEYCRRGFFFFFCQESIFGILSFI